MSMQYVQMKMTRRDYDSCNSRRENYFYIAPQSISLQQCYMLYGGRHAVHTLLEN